MGHCKLNVSQATILGGILFLIITLAIVLAFVPSYGIVHTRQDTCQKSLAQLSKNIHLYIKNEKCPPKYLEEIFAEHYLPNEMATLALCSYTKGAPTSWYNIYGFKLYTERYAYYPCKLDFCYFFDERLVEKNAILMYCPNYKLHNSKVPTVFLNGEVELLDWKQFQNLYKAQGEKLKRLGVSFSFAAGVNKKQ